MTTVAGPVSEEWPRSLLALMYHGIHDLPLDEGHFDPRYSVTSAAFEQQMLRLRARFGRAWVPGSQMVAAAGDEVMITFDDGDVADATVALPILLKLGLRAVFFITSGFVDRSGSVTSAQLRGLADAGMVIGAHGASHRFLSGLLDTELRGELVSSRILLEQISGRRVDMLALPGGRGGCRELEAARAAGYAHCFCSVPGINRNHAPDEYLQRVAITRSLDLKGFDQILSWRGTAVRRLRWRHHLLALPKVMIGDRNYDRLRKALVR